MFSSGSKKMAVFVCFLLFALSNPLILSAQKVPAIYMFGDSLVDVGNNNYIDLSVLKADFPHNGIDYPGGTATGRFCNGKNSADFIAEKVGLPTSPPYLANTSDVFLQGVSFASGGSGLLNATGEGFLQKCIPLTQQVGYFSAVLDSLVQQLGIDGAQQHLSKSLFGVIIGSNDLFAYFKSSNNNDTTPQQYIDQLISILQGLLKQLHGLGARKFVVTGVGPLGCTPQQRHNNDSEECVAEINAMVVKYNQALTTMLKELNSELSGINYSFFDSYTALSTLINSPSKYGFAEAKAACCGLGTLNADSFCTPLSVYCPNRSDHIFWDEVHPTEATDRLLIEMFFTGSHPLSTPMSLKELITL